MNFLDLLAAIRAEVTDATIGIAGQAAVTAESAIV
jgi:hypothetical protein